MLERASTKALPTYTHAMYRCNCSCNAWMQTLYCLDADKSMDSNDNRVAKE